MSTIEKTLSIMRDHLDMEGLDRLVPETKLVELYMNGHLDSLAVIELTLEFEEHFEIDIPDGDLDLAILESGLPKTIADIASYIDARVAQK